MLTKTRPEIVTDDQLNFLDDLHINEGKISLSELSTIYQITIPEAAVVISYWSNSYKERHNTL